MSSKQFYYDIDLVNVGQLLGTRLQNLSGSAMTALAADLGTLNQGLVVYNTTDRRIYVWNGTAFDPFQIDIAGDIKFRGTINAGNAGTVEKVSGYQYVVDTAGTLTAAGVTFAPSAVVEAGDQVLFTSDTQAYVLQRNDVQATETTLGNIRLATQSEANAGTVTDKAITPATLKGKLDPLYAAQAAKDSEQDARILATEQKNTEQDGRLTSVENRVTATEAKNVEQDGRLTAVESKNAEQDGRLTAVESKNTEQDGRLTSLEADRVKHYFASVNLGANTPFTVTHGLNLADRDGFVINTQFGNSQISLDIDSVSANAITLTSLVPLNGVKVTIIGRAAV